MILELPRYYLFAARQKTCSVPDRPTNPTTRLSSQVETHSYAPVMAATAAVAAAMAMASNDSCGEGICVVDVAAGAMTAAASSAVKTAAR